MAAMRTNRAIEMRSRSSLEMQATTLPGEWCAAVPCGIETSDDAMAPSCHVVTEAWSVFQFGVPGRQKRDRGVVVDCVKQS